MKNRLPILSIETSGINCSVALMMSRDAIYEINTYKKNIHSEKLLSMIGTVLKSADIRLDQLGHIAVSEGPGSFTGLRIGFAAAKGLAFGADIPIASIPTFEAMAFHLTVLLKEGTRFSINSVINTTEIYFAGFEKNSGNYRIVSPLSIIKKADYADSAAEYGYNFGDYPEKDPMMNPAIPTAQIISKWSYFFGKDLLNFNFDYIEPRYVKKFTPKRPKVK